MAEPLMSRPYPARSGWVCEQCVWGRGEHAAFCPRTRVEESKADIFPDRPCWYCAGWGRHFLGCRFYTDAGGGGPS